MSNSFTVQVAELCGSIQTIEDLTPEMEFQIFEDMVKAYFLSATGRLDFIFQDKILNTRKYGSCTLSELRMQAGALLTMVVSSSVEFVELEGAQGDEDDGHLEESFVRVCFLDDKNCILVRRSHSKSCRGIALRSKMMWDISRGSYECAKEGKLALCRWSCQYRRIREGISEHERLNRVNDSGWIPRAKTKMPDKWCQIELSQDGKWKGAETDLVAGDHVLGVRIAGFGSAAEAIRILAIGQ